MPGPTLAGDFGALQSSSVLPSAFSLYLTNARNSQTAPSPLQALVYLHPSQTYLLLFFHFSWIWVCTLIHCLIWSLNLCLPWIQLWKMFNHTQAPRERPIRSWASVRFKKTPWGQCTLCTQNILLFLSQISGEVRNCPRYNGEQNRHFVCTELAHTMAGKNRF